MILTELQLKQIFPNCPADKIKIYTLAFNKHFPKYKVFTARRAAAFLGQIAVESGELKYDKELRSKYNTLDPADKSQATGNAYDGRKSSLGNYVPGDGPKYIGRGCLQITGRANYARYGNKLNIDLIGNPELACTPDVAVQIALEYFVDRNIFAHADAWNLSKVTQLVNGTAKLHHDKRVSYSNRALAVLTAGETNVA